MTVAASSSLDRRARTALDVGWWALMALLPLGHLTGLRNTVTIVVVLLTLWIVRRTAWEALPARWTLLVLVVWCAASIAWSTVPIVSFAKWRSDLLIPLAAYVAAFGFARRTGSVTAVVAGMATSIVALAVLSVPAFFDPGAFALVAAHVPFAEFGNVASPLPRWYPGVGDASMAATFGACVLIVGRDVTSAIRTRWLALAALAVVLVVLAANNRAAVAALAIIFAIGAWSWIRAQPRHAQHRASGRRVAITLCVLGLGVCIAVGALLESSARDRLGQYGLQVEPGESAFVTLAERDTRPRIWLHYAEFIKREPWFGVGFGRTVPGIHYGTEGDHALAEIESNAYIHAHNIVLDWWLQTGIVGVALFIGALTLVVRDTVRAGRTGDPRRRAAAVSACALVALMIVRDMTDDFLVFGIATMFWALLGALAGLARGQAGPSSDRRPIAATRSPPLSSSRGRS